MKTFIQNAHPLFKSLANLFLIAGLVFCLGSCTEKVGPTEIEFPVETDPVAKYTGVYELMEDFCTSTKNRLEIRPYTPRGDLNLGNDSIAKMISISNLAQMKYGDVNAVWKGRTFIIERQEVINDESGSRISGELYLNDESELNVFYEISSPKTHHACIAEYVKY